MSTAEEHGSQTPPSEGVTWRKVAAWGAFAIPVLFLLTMVIFMEFIPFFIPFIVVFGLLGLWVLRGGRASLIVLAILSLLFIAMNAPFIIPTLAVPASVVDFVSTAWLLLAAITAVVGSLMALRRDTSARSARLFQRVMAGVAVLVVVFALVASSTYDDALEQEGDVALTTENIEFSPENLEAPRSGTVAVYVTNNDPTYHTFTIDELDVHLDIPADSTARIEFQAESGQYEFYCVPHESDMQGKLFVR